MLTGGTAHMDGFVDAVGEAVGVPVRIGDPLRRVKVGPHVAHDGQAGLARDRDRARDRGLMRAVNLLPRDVESQRFEAGRLPVLVAGGGIAAVTAAAAVLFMGASGSVSDQRSQLESVESAIASIPTDGQQPAVAPSTIAQERTDRVTALAAALTTRVPVDRLLRELAYVLPEDAWLTGLTASAPTGAAAAVVPGSAAPGAAATPGITIQGATYSHESVARVLARLSALPTLTDVRLTASARVEPAEPAGSRPRRRRRRSRRRSSRSRSRPASVQEGRREGSRRSSSRRGRSSRSRRQQCSSTRSPLWFLLVSPKQAEATAVADDVVAAELRLVEAQADSNRPQTAAPVGTGVSDVLRLAKAMPSSADQPGLVLELDRLARSTGVKLGSITPREPVRERRADRRRSRSS